jgi:hypothetical protein
LTDIVYVRARASPRDQRLHAGFTADPANFAAAKVVDWISCQFGVATSGQFADEDDASALR